MENKNISFEEWERYFWEEPKPGTKYGNYLETLRKHDPYDYKEELLNMKGIAYLQYKAGLQVVQDHAAELERQKAEAAKKAHEENIKKYGSREWNDPENVEAWKRFVRGLGFSNSDD